MASRVGKKASNIFVWILLVLLIVGLAGFSVTNFGSQAAAIARVGDKEIEVNDYFRAAQAALRNYQQQTGQALTVAQPEAQQLLESVRAQLVFNAAVEDAAAKMGLSTGDAVVAKNVRGLAAFQGIDGTFDRMVYERALQQNGTNVADFEDDIRSETARTLIQAAVAGGVGMPDIYLNRLMSYLGERRSFRVVRFNRAMLTDDQIKEPTEAEVAAYYEANMAEFMLPERKKITYAWVTPEMLLDQVTVEDNALRELYEQRSSEFNQPERRLVERLVMPDQASADAARAQLDAGETTFPDLVAARNLTLDDIDLGETTAASLGANGAEVFALPEPGIVGPLQTDLGPAFFRVNAILEASSIPFEDARPILSVELQLEAARRRIDADITGIEDLLASGASLEDVAAETDMQIGTVEYYNDVADPIVSYEAFRAAADAITENDFPEVTALDDGGIFAMRMDETLPAQQQPLEAVREAATQAAQSAAEAALLREMANTLQAQIAVGASLDAGQGTVETYDAMTRRTAFVPGAEPDLTEAVFEMSMGEMRQFASFGSIFLVQLDAVAPPDASDESLNQLRAALKGQLDQSLQTDIYQSFARAMATEAGVTFDNQVINAVHAELR